MKRKELLKRMSNEEKTEEKTQKGLSRRAFFKGSALAAVGIAAGGLLTGCSKKASVPESGQTEEVKAKFEIPPAPISDKDIKETIATDIVVVGAGFAGLSAAVSAGQAGAKVVLLEKNPNPGFRGYDYAAINSKVQKSVGNELDPVKITREIMRYGGYRGDQRVVSLFVNHSGEANDWLVDMATQLGCTYDVWKVEDMMTPNATLDTYPTMSFVLKPPAEAMSVMPKGTLPPTAGMAWVLVTQAKKAGVDIRFKTPAVQLIRPDGKGRVTGIIAKNEDGSYTKYNVSKGVILCAGDYGNEPEMLKKYIPSSKNIQGIAYTGKGNTGDGHKMGLWIGAAMDEAPHAPMYFDIGMVEEPGLADSAMRQPWLAVNERGERYANEDLPYAYISNAVLKEPGGHTRWTVWDSKWPEEAPKFQMTACKSLKSLFHDPKRVQALIEKGVIKSANSIEELAQKMNMPLDTFKATVARYNDLAKKGADEDFHKRSVCMTTIDKPPLYAAHLATVLLVTLGGLQVNDNLQVLDNEKNVIPGLYAAGNNSGSYFSVDYPVTMPGNSHGRAYTFGYLSGKNAAKMG
jgi:fumarate reductase flavoprotein subunit